MYKYQQHHNMFADVTVSAFSQALLCVAPPQQPPPPCCHHPVVATQMIMTPRRTCRLVSPAPLTAAPLALCQQGSTPYWHHLQPPGIASGHSQSLHAALHASHPRMDPQPVDGLSGMGEGLVEVAAPPDARLGQHVPPTWCDAVVVRSLTHPCGDCPCGQAWVLGPLRHACGRGRLPSSRSPAGREWAHCVLAEPPPWRALQQRHGPIWNVKPCG